MRATKKNDLSNQEKITVTTDGLQSLLDCGRVTAVEIGTLAGAKVMIGKRVLWSVSRVQKYIETIATE